MPWHDDAAIRHGIKISCAEIISRVKTDGEPERSRAAEGETKKHSDHEHAQRTHRPFARIAKVHGAKGKGKQQGGGPESHSRAQRELQISPEEELFEDSH